MSGQYLSFWEIQMARRDDQDVYDLGEANCRALANLRPSGLHRSLSASRLRLEQRGADVDRCRQIAAEPMLDEVLREPVVRLLMKCDNVTEDQLLHFIRIARQHMKR
jgi:hypothetical protein